MFQIEIRGRVLEWLESYLNNRTQKELIIKLKVIDHDVPQGSVLGPLLFILYLYYILMIKLRYVR